MSSSAAGRGQTPVCPPKHAQTDAWALVTTPGSGSLPLLVLMAPHRNVATAKE